MFTHERSLKTATVFIMYLWSEFFQIEGKYTTGIKRLRYVKIISGKSFEASQKLFEQHKVTPSSTYAWPSSVDQAIVMKRLS